MKKCVYFEKRFFLYIFSLASFCHLILNNNNFIHLFIQSHVELMVVNKIVHPNYNFFTYEFDLALLKLESKVTFQENIIPICLPGNDDSLVGEYNVLLV